MRERRPRLDYSGFLQARVGSDSFVEVAETLKPGDTVRVKDGRWKALIGVVGRDVKTSERITILLESIKYQSRLTIESYWVEKIG